MSGKKGRSGGNHGGAGRPPKNAPKAFAAPPAFKQPKKKAPKKPKKPTLPIPAANKLTAAFARATGAGASA